jgi:antitoxin component of MazEF toxin-antitoxin module
MAKLILPEHVMKMLYLMSQRDVVVPLETDNDFVVGMQQGQVGLAKQLVEYFSRSWLEHYDLERAEELAAAQKSGGAGGT